MSKKSQATFVLCLMAIGFVCTYPLNSFWGNLLNHGFLAALIGGLADWFAVTALFRKPLGFISYRTEILPRNRERIMDEIVSFIGRDLLNPQYIISNLKNYDMAVMVVDYANNLGGRGKLKFAVRELVLQVISTLDTEKIGKSLAIALKSRRKKFQHGAYPHSVHARLYPNTCRRQIYRQYDKTRAQSCSRPDKNGFYRQSH